MECSTIVPQISLPWDSKLTTADHTRQKGLRDRFSNPKGGGMFCKIVNPVNPVDSVKIAGLQLCVQFAWSPGPDSPSLWEPALSLGQPSCVTPEPGRRCYEPAKHLRVQNGVTCCPPPPPPWSQDEKSKAAGCWRFQAQFSPYWKRTASQRVGCLVDEWLPIFQYWMWLLTIPRICPQDQPTV